MILRTLTPVLSVIIAIILFIFFVHPKYNEIVTVQAEIAEYENAILKYNNFTNNLEAKLAAKKNRSALDNEHLDRLVPDEIDETQLLVDIESLAKRNALLFGNVDVINGGAELIRNTRNEVAAVEESDELKTVDISFEVIGTYEQFKAFLADMEKSMTIFEVVEMKIDVDDSAFQQFAVTVRVYSLPKM